MINEDFRAHCPGSLLRMQAMQRDFLGDVGTLDLLHELAARLERAEAYPTSEEAILVGQLLKDQLSILLDVHNNRFSRQRLEDYYYSYLKPKGFIRPPVKGAVWVEVGCGSQNPVGFLFMLLMLGAQRAIGIDLDRVQDEASMCKALANVAAMMLIDPNAILVFEPPIHRQELLRNVQKFDLAKLKKGDPTGMDGDRLSILNEPVESLSLKDCEADVVFSNSFLEHVADLDRVISELARITRLGGVGIHTVDYRDHGAYADPPGHPLAFLEIESEERLVGECNRVRPSALRKIFERHGFEVLEEEVWERIDLTPDIRERFADRFKAMPDEELNVLLGQITVRRCEGNVLFAWSI